MIGLVKLDGLDQIVLLGKINDGWGEKFGSLEEFEYRKYGIRWYFGDVVGSRIWIINKKDGW